MIVAVEVAVDLAVTVIIGHAKIDTTNMFVLRRVGGIKERIIAFMAVGHLSQLITVCKSVRFFGRHVNVNKLEIYK